MAQDGGTRRRRSERYEQTPQRVESAAQAMNGARRGYVPPADMRNTGHYTGYDQFQQNPGQAYSYDSAPQNQFTGGQYINGAPQYGYAPAGQMTGAQTAVQNQYTYENRLNQEKPSREQYHTGSYSSVGGHRGYVVDQPPPGNEKKKSGSGKGRKAAVIIALVVLLAGIGTGGYYYLKEYQRTQEINNKVEPYNNLFCPGVYVDGINLEGMTPEQALNSVQSQIQQRNDAWYVQLVYEGQVLSTIDAGMLGMSVSIGDVLNQAWLQGHEGDNEQRYAAMLELEQNNYHGYTAVPSGDNAVIDSLLAELKSQIDAPAEDAALLSFDPDLSYPFTFKDEVYGKRLNTEPVIEELYHMVSEMKTGTVELVPDTVYPNITKNDLQLHYMLRSSVYTPIASSSTENRNNNIRRAFEFINGYVLESGASFSFNNVVGQRTTNNGFFTAIEYAYGEHVEGVGGGVCQASTTVYQAAVEAGLQVTKREPHSDSVTYTDYGKDATVYWVGKRKIDLVFKNNTDGPIYIVAAVQEDPSNKRRLIAKVSMYGEYMGDVRYELQSEVVQELEPPTDPVYVKDTEGAYVTYTDQQKSVSKAKPGYVVQSYRLEYTGNELTARKELYTDTYEPKPERIYVGTKKRE